MKQCQHLSITNIPIIMILFHSYQIYWFSYTSFFFLLNTILHHLYLKEHKTGLLSYILVWPKSHQIHGFRWNQLLFFTNIIWMEVLQECRFQLIYIWRIVYYHSKTKRYAFDIKAFFFFLHSQYNYFWSLQSVFKMIQDGAQYTNGKKMK